jgi:hypothetical protein
MLFMAAYKQGTQLISREWLHELAAMIDEELLW